MFASEEGGVVVVVVSKATLAHHGSVLRFSPVRFVED